MTPPIQTGRAVLPHPAFRSVALTMDWLRLQTKGIEFVLSAARAFAPLTAFTAVHSRVLKQPKAFTAPARSAFWALCRFGLFVRSLTQLYLPTSLGSTIITRFGATTDTLTCAGQDFRPIRGPGPVAPAGFPASGTRSSNHSVPTHLMCPTWLFVRSPFSTGIDLWLLAFPSSLGLRSLLAGSPSTSGRIGFVILRTSRLPPLLPTMGSPHRSPFGLPGG